MKKLFGIFVVLLLLSGCRKELESVEETTPSGFSDVTITFTTKSDRSTADDSFDGLAFHNLLVLLVDVDNKVYAKEWIPTVYESGNSGDHEHWDRKTVTFERVQIGTYTVYAYANIDHEIHQISGAEIDEVELQMVQGDTFLPDRELASYAANTDDVPGFPLFNGQKKFASIGMIMTGYNTLDVGVTSASCEVPLLRTVTRLNVYINNHSDQSCFLKNLHFSNFNASHTYLLDHRVNGHPGIPAANVYRPLPSFDYQVEGGMIEILPNGRDSLVYSTVLYENENTAIEYKIFGEAEMDGNTKTIHVKDTELKTKNNVNSMAVNDVWPILLVNPLTNNGKIVGNSSPKSANFKGGNKAYVTNFVKSYSDDEAFIFYLKKTDSSHWSFYRDAACTDICTWGGVNSFTLAQGTFTNGNSYDFANEDLCNFKTSNGYFLYNTGTTTLNTRSATSKECQWAIYRPKVSEGSTLRLVDNETGQVSVLDRMLRNQELNIILNVYYNQTMGVFDFDVDNTYWTGGHTMTHIFK